MKGEMQCDSLLVRIHEPNNIFNIKYLSIFSIWNPKYLNKLPYAYMSNNE